MCISFCQSALETHIVCCYYNNNKKKKIYNAHLVMNHKSEARAVARWRDVVCYIINEMGYKLRLGVALETVGRNNFNGSRN